MQLLQVNSQPDGKRGKIGKEKNDVFLFFAIDMLCDFRYVLPHRKREPA